MELTAQQRRILASDAADIVVTAGAGSGKTHVLVERYIGLLARHRIPEIAAVTFTEAAATEMRERVRRAVMESDALAAHRRELDEATIGTIHSLCLQLLRQHPVEAGIDPSAGVLAEHEGELLLLSVCTDALEAAAEEDDRGVLALREIDEYQLSQLLPVMVSRRDEVRAAFATLPGEGPEAWAGAIRERLDAALEPAVERTRSVVREQLEWAAAQRVAGESDALSGRLDEVRAAAGDPNAGEWRSWEARLAEITAIINLQGGAKATWRVPAAEVRAALGRVRELGREIAKLPRWNDHDALALRVVEALRALFEDACARYAAAKREQHTLDFLDLELEAVRLLREHPRVARDVRAGIRHLLVDEVQDTNPPQIELIRLLIGDRADASSPHLFLVGDAKQSIYRFRGADVRQFNGLRETVRQRGGELLPLSQSFRTHDGLVDLLNSTFTSVFGEAGEDYEAEMETMLGRGGEHPPAPHVTLTPIANERPDGSRASEREQRRMEADLIAGRIRWLIDERRPVWDRREEAYRPAQAGDVAILLRRLLNVHTFEQALEAYDLPYATPAGAGFFTRQEVLDLTNLLQWLAEPDSEIALAGALRSPLFMLDDPTLLALRERGGSLFGALRAPPDGLDAALRERCAHARAVLGELQRLAETERAHDVIERALELTGVEAAWRPIEGGEQAVANLRKLAGIARTLAGRSLDEFAEYLVWRRDETNAREGQAVVERRDAVRIMTVYRAKGLEFPVVFLPESHLAAWVPTDAVRWRRDGGISVTMRRELGAERRRRPGFYEHLARLDRAEEDAEHRRLFYVGATRAADYLFISGDPPGLGSWLEQAGEALAGRAREAGVDLLPAALVDLGAIAARPAPPVVTPPPAAVEVDYVPPLLARPRVIPVRASTPVTALRASEPAFRPAQHGDGLGALRGSVAHRAIELSFTQGGRPHLVDLVTEIASTPLDPVSAQAVAAEVEEMLDRFAGSALATVLRDPGTVAHFELPFAWDWDGVPVHGSIDLAYRDVEGWHVVDFKTDQRAGRTLEAAGEPYLAQLGLYGRALERAVGAQPALALVFLRTGELFEPGWQAVDAAIEAARLRVDAGALLDPEATEYVLEAAALE